MSKFEIRLATPENAEELLEYLRIVGGESDNLSFGAYGLPFSTEEEYEFLQSMQENSRNVMYLAWIDGKIVGDGSLSVYPRRMNHRAELGISVVREEWNKGIGSSLMEKLIAFAGNHGIELIDLQVRSDNAAAIHLYKVRI